MTTSDRRRSSDDPIVVRVRALLAKAESTEFEAEADALMAKAQELVTRYCLDEALLRADGDVGDPLVRRIHLADPYARARWSIVVAVARANRCHTVYTPVERMVTVFGYEADLDAVELLSASLLTQAHAAMLREGPRRDSAGRSRTRSFRRAFLLGFAARIGERLREVNEAQTRAASDADDRLLPVLASREQRVEAAVRRAFPDVARRTIDVGNAAGWFAGRTAAETADIDPATSRLPSG